MEGSKSSRMIDPQCPHIKSSPPVPDILLSVRRIERFSVVLGPTGSMSIVAISSPDMRQLRGHRFLENTARSTRLRPMSHFCLGRYVVQRPGNAKNGGLPGAGFELSVPRQMDLCKHRESPRIATPGAQIGGELMKMDPTASLAYPASMRGGRPAVGKPGAS